MKEMWEKPRILVEEFAPNDYVAVCYELSCQNGGKPEARPINKETGNRYTDVELWGEKYSKPGAFDYIKEDGRYYKLDDSHSGACTEPDKNAIRVNGDNSISIWESSNWGETLNSKVTTSINLNGDDELGKGDLFAWVTFSQDLHKYWLHWAIAGVANLLNPNRS